jgi:hypothetical protein
MVEFIRQKVLQIVYVIRFSNSQVDEMCFTFISDIRWWKSFRMPSIETWNIFLWLGAYFALLSSLSLLLTTKSIEVIKNLHLRSHVGTTRKRVQLILGFCAFLCPFAEQKKVQLWMKANDENLNLSLRDVFHPFIYYTSSKNRTSNAFLSLFRFETDNVITFPFTSDRIS